MTLIIENPNTGETRKLMKDAEGRYPNFMLPWQVKGIMVPLADYPYRQCSSCGEKAVYESS